MRCELCGHEWNERTNDPVACPNCKRYDWKTKEEPSPVKNPGDDSNEKEVTKNEN